MDFFDRDVVNFRFGCAELLKNCNGSLFGRFGERGLAYDLANFYQPAAVMMLMGSVMFMMVLVFMIMGLRVVVSMDVLVRYFRPSNSWSVLFSVCDHIHFGGSDATAVHARNVQLGTEIKSSDRLFKKFRRNSGVDQCSKKHVAANSRKAV